MDVCVWDIIGIYYILEYSWDLMGHVTNSYDQLCLYRCFWKWVYLQFMAIQWRNDDTPLDFRGYICCPSWETLDVANSSTSITHNDVFPLGICFNSIVIARWYLGIPKDTTKGMIPNTNLRNSPSPSSRDAITMIFQKYVRSSPIPTFVVYEFFGNVLLTAFSAVPEITKLFVAVVFEPACRS